MILKHLRKISFPLTDYEKNAGNTGSCKYFCTAKTADKRRTVAGRLLSAALLCMLLVSCSYSKACYSNLKGVFSFEKGNFGNALISYRDAASETENNSEYIYYNISRVYRDMGENTASSGILNSLTGLGDKKFEYRINYLKAVISYNEGRYDDAVLFYKNSIKIDNSDIELLKGIELAFKQLENRKGGEKDKRGNSGSISAQADAADKDSGKKDGGSPAGSGKGAADVLDLIFTEEVRLCPGNGYTKEQNTPDW